MLIYPELKPLLFQLYPATAPKQKLIPDNLSYHYINGSVYKGMGNYFGWGKYSMVMGDRVVFKVVPPLLDQVQKNMSTKGGSWPVAKPSRHIRRRKIYYNRTEKEQDQRSFGQKSARNSILTFGNLRSI